MSHLRWVVTEAASVDEVAEAGCKRKRREPGMEMWASGVPGESRLPL